ncbi:16S rRNA (uracil(1498)-N(3))-methyltransferase [Flagellimonas aquimarina]|jgi:16S rRNA (uracil1498-N3)-methyltransferase|uniref:Ribosomal RNA small subunit methyltransferase E n=1 Tax=Flagellimonas aquimarina TaxID=2201895 RepID=A0A316KVB7_9FLAO|nr:16S rRNA (uracil(1498)-N(3))-methyltransferase [Allomuricauda koreensis]PWL37694.1 16S rRNA (uracil(1498)-N(3))-methyltransferase [Allomuricauda koreensis]
MQLFYNPSLDNSFKQFFFPSEESKHILKVLRKKEGDILHITNGKGYLFKAEILDADIRKCKAQIISVEKSIPKRYSLHLAVAPTKMNERYEWFLEKATEIGIDEITPVICEHSERKTIKLERMERVLQSAMKQSLQTHLPRLNPAVSYKEFMSQKLSGLKFIAHCDEGEKMELKRRVAADKDIIILIGPEGDFSKTEIDFAYTKGFVPVSLGNNRLRTETAAIVACTTVSIINS